MKQLRLMMMLLASVLFFACSDDDISIQGEIDVPQEVDLMQLEMWSYEVPFSIKSDSEWRIETTGDIGYAMPAEGTGNATVQLCIVDNGEDNRRSGELRIIFPRDEKKNITLKLGQKYAGDYEGNADVLSVGNRIYAVGYGYNTTGGYANPESVKRPILQFSKMAAEELIVLGPVNANFDIRQYSSSSIETLSNDLATKANVQGGFGKFKTEITGSFNNNYFSSNNYEYALTFINLAIRYANVEANLDEMRSEDYMTAAAYKAINGLSKTYVGSEGIRKLIDDYGTHLCISARLGGRVRHSMAVDISKVTNAYDVSAYAEASYAGLFVSGGGSVDEKFKKSYEKNANACDIRVSVLGGNEANATALGTKLNEANLNAWKSSVNETNMALVAFNDNDADPSLIPLYELVDAEQYPARYQELKSYMEGDAITKDYPTLSMSYDCGTITHFAIPSFSEDGTLVKQVKIDGQVVAQICEEYIPVINKDSRVKVIYPVINNKPRINMGFFVGNKSHKPARVAWEGTSLAVREYSDMEMNEMTEVYIKGASITPTNATDKENIVTGTVSDEYMLGYRGDTSGNYPIVKIFDKYWTKENYCGKKKNNGNAVTYYEERNGNIYYSCSFGFSEGVAPAGWRIPAKQELETIASTLTENGLSQIGKEFFKGGKLGFNASCVGFYRLKNSGLTIKGEFVPDDGKAKYLVYASQDKNDIALKVVSMEENGGFGFDSGDYSYISMRLVKE